MEKIVLFHPYIPKKALKMVNEVLKTRWIGQGPKVNEFEKRFKSDFANKSECIAVGSGTDALHLAYICANINPGDEVIVPVFTCTATNIPLLYIGANIKFADVDPQTLNIDTNHVQELVNEKTKAIVCVHYGGLPCDLTALSKIAKKYNIPLIQDSAHALGAKYKNKNISNFSDFSCYSFQAIKSITTGDGGMLVVSNKENQERAKRIRWFGIDREKKSLGIWENDITEIGYKYQMTDIAAVMGIAGIDKFEEQLSHRRKLFFKYEKKLKNIPGLRFVNSDDKKFFHGAWLSTIIVQNRTGLQKKLMENNIETNQVHYRNDRYKIFSDFNKNNLPNMDKIEDDYLVLPLHSKVEIRDVERISNVIKSGW